MSFSYEVNLVAFAGLDLYLNDERGGEALIHDGTIMAVGDEMFDDGGNGWAVADDLEMVGTSFVFTVDGVNDLAGVADGALARLEIAPVPLPAGILLLGGALGGLALTRRRKAA